MKVILVIPATNALSEKSFGASRRIKNYLRVYHDAKRDEQPFMLMSLYKEDADNLCLIDVAENFYSRNTHR